MMAVMIIILVLLGIVTWILIVPVVIYMDTEEQLYYVGFSGIKAFLIIESWDKLKIKVRPPFFSFDINIAQGKADGKRKTRGKKKKAKRRKIPFLSIVRLVWHMLRTFRVKALRLNIDTDDYTLNAQLIPVFFALSQGNVRLNTNFHGRVDFHVEVENQLANMVRVFLPFLIKHKFHR